MGKGGGQDGEDVVKCVCDAYSPSTKAVPD